MGRMKVHNSKLEDARIAAELHYPEIVIKMLKKEDDPIKRQRILADARWGVYDDNADEQDRPVQHYCRECTYFCRTNSTRKGVCLHPDKDNKTVRWESYKACSKKHLK